MLSGQREGREIFDEVALLYDDIRPGYPTQLFADVITAAALPAQGRVLEIGCGTGQATLPFAQQGYTILCIELGARLLQLARRNLARYPNVAFSAGAFEDWQPEARPFDLAISATAFHWIDPAIRYAKTARALRPGGTLAIFWNVHVQSEKSSAFFEQAQEIYRQQAPEIARTQPLPQPDAVPTPYKGELERSGHFDEVSLRCYHWDAVYDTASYLRLLETYSDHRSLAPSRRERLFYAIASLIESGFNGRISKEYVSLLYLARRS